MGHHQDEDPYRLRDFSGGYQVIYYYRLAPNIQYGRASIFQEASRGVAVRVKTNIGYEEYA